MRNPPRGLRPGEELIVAERLRGGASWQGAVDGLGGDRRARLVEAASCLDKLAGIERAGDFVRLARTAGGLDRHFAEHEQTFGGAEQVELEQLDDAEREARGRSVADYAAWVVARRDALLGIRDDEHGIELTTVHRAKGREWPTVIVFGFDVDQLPHKRALAAGLVSAAGEGIEAERRVAYVALTRAKKQLHVLATQGSESPFLWQAGLADEPVAERRPPPPRGGKPLAARAGSRPAAARRAGPATGPLGRAINEITRVGAGYPVRTSPSRVVGLQVAAWAIRHNLVTAENLASTLSVASYVGAVPGFDAAEAAAAIDRAGAPADELVRKLRPAVRAALADELDRLAGA